MLGGPTSDRRSRRASRRAGRTTTLIHIRHQLPPTVSLQTCAVPSSRQLQTRASRTYCPQTAVPRHGTDGSLARNGYQQLSTEYQSTWQSVGSPFVNKTGVPVPCSLISVPRINLSHRRCACAHSTQGASRCSKIGMWMGANPHPPAQSHTVQAGLWCRHCLAIQALQFRPLGAASSFGECAGRSKPSTRRHGESWRRWSWARTWSSIPC